MSEETLIKVSLKIILRLRLTKQGYIHLDIKYHCLHHGISTCMARLYYSRDKSLRSNTITIIQEKLVLTHMALYFDSGADLS